MAFVDYVLTKYKIRYTVDGGTEVGSIRHIFPIRQCKFGPLTVKCKNNPTKPFNKYYGDDWMDVAYTGNHTFNHKRSKKINLRKHKALLKPALPNNDAWKKWADKKHAIKK